MYVKEYSIIWKLFLLIVRVHTSTSEIIDKFTDKNQETHVCIFTQQFTINKLIDLFISDCIWYRNKLHNYIFSAFSRKKIQCIFNLFKISNLTCKLLFNCPKISWTCTADSKLCDYKEKDNPYKHIFSSIFTIYFDLISVNSIFADKTQK